MERNKNKRKYLENFNPGVCELSKCKHQDFLLRKFNAGEEFQQFNDFITNEAIEYAQDGNGVTYVVFNEILDEQQKVIGKEVVAFYTLSATSIPYEDRIRLDEEEAKELNREFDIQICGIPSIELKMFAVDIKYQDLFYIYEGEELPIAAWVIKSIIHEAQKMLVCTLGFKALLLHTLPSAKAFYEKNGFHMITPNMHPLHGLDSDLDAMYVTFRNVAMNYDK